MSSAHRISNTVKLGVIERFSALNLLNIWEFVYFVWGLSPHKRRVIQWRNFARRLMTTMCRTCAGFCVYRGRRYENNDIFPKVRTCRPTPAGWLVAAAQGLCITINSACLAAAWAATVTSQACRYQSSCSGPTVRNSLSLLSLMCGSE